jgi:hypothetical protein
MEVMKMSHSRKSARCLFKEARADTRSVELARTVAPAMYMRLSEGVDEQGERSLSTSFKVSAGFLAFLVLLIGPLALPGFAQARSRDRAAQHVALVLARKSDSGGGDDHAGGDGHGGNQQGDNPGDGHNAVIQGDHSKNVRPATHHSVHKVGTANTKHSKNARAATHHSQHVQPATQNSVNKVGTANTNQSQNARPATHHSQNVQPATQNSVNKVGTANTNQSQNVQP